LFAGGAVLRNFEHMVNRVVFYKGAIPADGGGGPYDSPILSVNIPLGVPLAQASEFARKLFKEQMGSTPEDWGVRERVE
jgi:hypothetical protein